LENFLDFEYPDYSRADVYNKRREFAGDDQKIVLYTGNFLPYQGIPLFLEAAAKVQDKRALFLLVGDTPEAVERMRSEAVKLGISDKVFFTGQVDPALIPLFISLSDVLVSPRLSGTNTPLKIYSFLKSGKPVVATNLWTHSQVLNDKIAILVDPDADSMAVGIRFALFDKESLAIARAAKSLAGSKYILPKYMEKIELVLAKAKHRD
jgi:glycosyltransferase involved in cell wall biosynthesis